MLAYVTKEHLQIVGVLVGAFLGWFFWQKKRSWYFNFNLMSVNLEAFLTHQKIRIYFTVANMIQKNSEIVKYNNLRCMFMHMCLELS